MGKKHRGENWDPKAVKVVIAELKKIRRKQREDGALPRSAAQAAARPQARAKKVIGKEVETPAANLAPLEPQRIVTKDEELRRQVSVQLSPSRFRR